MSYAVRVVQARCAALGFWPGPIDGRMGPRTAQAEREARASQAAKGLPFIHPSGLTRIHWHWTGGWGTANADDKRSYQTLIEADGTVLRLVDPTVRRSHTLNANGGAVGLSLCGMVGAVERPFSFGDAPITPAQIDALAAETAELCAIYDIPVSRWSTLSHSEIQPTLGIKQNFKWDINWLPGMAGPGDPITCGDKIRALVEAKMR
jgi:hypothetical protein